MWHTCGFSPVWTRRCILSTWSLTNPFPQKWQTWYLILKWAFSWRLAVAAVLNDFPQRPHGKTIPKWFFRLCCEREFLLGNFAGQSSQVMKEGRTDGSCWSLCCARMWSFKVHAFSTPFLQCGHLYGHSPPWTLALWIAINKGIETRSSQMSHLTPPFECLAAKCSRRVDESLNL